MWPTWRVYAARVIINIPFLIVATTVLCGILALFTPFCGPRRHFCPILRPASSFFIKMWPASIVEFEIPALEPFLNWCFRCLPVVYLVCCCLSIATTAMTSPMKRLFSSLLESLEKFWKIFSPSSTLEQVTTWTPWMTTSNCNISAVNSSFSQLYQFLRPLQSEVCWATKMLNHQSATPTWTALCTRLHRCQFINIFWSIHDKFAIQKMSHF